MPTWMRIAALAVIALTAACSTGPAAAGADRPGGAGNSGPALGSYDHPACVAARDLAVLEGLRWLSDIEVSGGEAAVPNSAVFSELARNCSANAGAAYSDFLVRTHSGFEPASPNGVVARRMFLTMGCGKHNPFELSELSDDARRVCTGG